MRILAFTAAATAALAITGVAHAETVTAAPQVAGKGVVGVCVRWGDDAHHLAEAVVVDSSGDATLDQAVPETLRSMTWDKPDGYAGQWLGLSVGVSGAQPADTLPDCDGLDDASAVSNIPLKTPYAKRI
jgi:hypothetical protein